MISSEVLLEFGAETVSLDKNTIIFNEGESPRYFFCLLSGSVKMFNLTEDGKEFIQGIFEAGQSFGEPPILGGFKYPASAITLKKSELIRLKKDSFIELLKARYDVHLAFTTALSNRLYYKSMIMREVSVHSAAHRILTLLNYLKKEHGGKEPYTVNLSRQQIAELTGLRAETVIRTLKKMEEHKEVTIIDRKIVI
ncbi:MAG: Crp/Fnr family transcriptional regulator [Bacteroidota bacterium]